MKQRVVWGGLCGCLLGLIVSACGRIPTNAILSDVDLTALKRSAEAISVLNTRLTLEAQPQVHTTAIRVRRLYTMAVTGPDVNGWFTETRPLKLPDFTVTTNISCQMRYLDNQNNPILSLDVAETANRIETKSTLITTAYAQQLHTFTTFTNSLDNPFVWDISVSGNTSIVYQPDQIKFKASAFSFAIHAEDFTLTVHYAIPFTLTCAGVEYSGTFSGDDVSDNPYGDYAPLKAAIYRNNTLIGTISLGQDNQWDIFDAAGNRLDL